MLRKLKWQIPGEPLADRNNWCQGPVPGRGPAVEKHWSRLPWRNPHVKVLSRVSRCQPVLWLFLSENIFFWFCCTIPISPARLDIRARCGREGPFENTCPDSAYTLRPGEQKPFISKYEQDQKHKFQPEYTCFSEAFLCAFDSLDV